jgi:hypothetical protein
MPAKRKAMTREELLASLRKPPLRREEFEFEGGAVVYIRELSAREQLEVNKRNKDKDKSEAESNVDSTIYVLWKAVVDGDGDPLFENEEQAKCLLERSGTEFRRLCDAATRINETIEIADPQAPTSDSNSG